MIWDDFNPRPPCGGRPQGKEEETLRTPFQSTSPVRGTTPPSGSHRPSAPISIHVPRAGDDAHDQSPQTEERDFNPRPPCGGRPVLADAVMIWDDFNPRPPCGGRPAQSSAIPQRRQFQSTSPVRGTTRVRATWTRWLRISIHVPRAGDDVVVHHPGGLTGLFQSTSPVRGTTSTAAKSAERITNFNPRPPCGGRPGWRRSTRRSTRRFQSTSPVRGTTL